MVGEPEAAGFVEDEVVGADQPPAVAAVVDGLEAAGGEVEALDRAALMAGRRGPRKGEPHLLVPGEGAAVVRDPQRSVRADGGAVGAAAGLDERLPAAVGKDPGDPLALDLGDD